MGIQLSKKNVTKEDPVIEKENNPVIEKDSNSFKKETKEDKKQFIERYEYIKNLKHLNDIDKMIDIINNTNWEAMSCKVEASAPPLQIEMQTQLPIAIATPIEPNINMFLK